MQEVNITIGSWLYNEQRLSYRFHENKATREIDALLIQDPTNWYTDNIEWNFVDKRMETIVLEQ